jgi:hypothetical protein
MEGKKNDMGKSRVDLLLPEFLLEVGDVLALGATKYGQSNWRLVSTQRYVAATLRHFFAFMSGEIVDAESGKQHLAHCATNIMFLWEKTREASNVARSAERASPEATD